MKKSQLSDKQLEEILARMPKIRDHRDPSDIYQNIAQKVEKRRTPAWILPSLASAAVLFLVFILSSGLMGSNQSADKSVEQQAVSDEKSVTEMDSAFTEETKLEEKKDKQENMMMMDQAESIKNQSKNSTSLKKSDPSAGLTALYESELFDGSVQAVTYVIPDQAGQILVPVTVTVPNVEGKPWFETFTESMAKLTEDEWGLTDFYPIDATLTYDKATKTMNMDVKENHPYRQGSVSNTMLLEAMAQNLASQDVKELTFSTEGKKGIDFGHYGVIEKKPVPNFAIKERAYFIFKPEGTGDTYLVPTKESFDSFETALSQMRKANEDLKLEATIPDDFAPLEIKVEEEQSLVRIFLDGDTGLQELSSFEAILLTAKEFGYQSVKFENAGIDTLGPFNLNEPVPVPKAPNKKYIR